MAGRDSGQLTVLFVANYPANTGFAWSHIERLFASVAAELEERRGARTLVAYPEMERPPETLEGSVAQGVALDASLRGWSSLWSTLRFIRRERVRLLYLTDRRVWDWRYALLRVAGVRRIMVHDRKSGAGAVPAGLRRLVKTQLLRLPWITPDTYVAVSEFVRQRLIRGGPIPPGKVVLVYNGFPIPTEGDAEAEDATVRQTYGLDEGVPVVACACRAAQVKGVDYLFRAFDRLASSGVVAPTPYLVYLGDGPRLEDLRRLRDDLEAGDHIILGGYVPEAVRKLRTADLFVVPSLWQDAFPSAVLEPMSWAKPVIASAVGGIPEMIEDGVSGLLVAPADESGLAEAMSKLLMDRAGAIALGVRAQEKVAADFRLTDQIRAISDLIIDEL